MKACEKLNIDISNIYPVIIGKTESAKTEWNASVGYHISTLRNYAWKFLISSGIYEEMFEDDKYFTRSIGKYEKNSHESPMRNLDEAYVDIHYPNGIMRLYYQHNRHVLFFRDPNYGKNMEKPQDPGPCNSGCENGSFYNLGTLYPCSHCMEIQRYKLKLKDWEQSTGGETC